MKTGYTGVTDMTPKNILFGAGTIHKGLKYTKGSGESAGSWNFDASIVGATNGGSKLSIVPEVTPIEADGVNVAAKGLKKKTGEKATMEINLIEMTKDIIKAATFAKDGISPDANYDLIESKTDIDAGDYWDNIAFVGVTLEDKKPIIAILDNALCTNGFEPEPKNKEGAVTKYTFECHAELSGDLQTLPWHIYYPKRTA